MKIYSCEIRGQAASLDAYLNEYHIYSSDGASHGYSTSLLPWMERQNVFRIQVAASAKAKEGAPVKFSVAATVEEDSRSQTLVRMSFPEGIAPPDVASLPFDTSDKHLTAGHNLGFVCEDERDIVEKPWKTTPKTITEPGEIFRLYAEIQRLFIEGNVDQLMGLSRARISFGAKLCGQSRVDYEKDVHDDLRSTLAGRPQWRSVQNPDRELTVHEFLPSKVVRVLNLQGNPPLRTVPDADGIRFGYDVILAMTSGGLVWIM
jgi:hypothetical protein